jgi:hypothetical protein
MAFGSADNGGSSATPAIWNTLGSQTQQHLEAYILRTTVKSPQNSSITWYYDVDFLPLDNDAMVAHTRNLGSGYSVIKAIGELSPEQLRFVQERTKARDSQLVSVQFGVAADVVTSMGTFKVKPVIFVVKTAAAPAGPKSVFNKASFQNPSVPAAGSLFGVSAKATSSGLFGTNTNLLSTSKSSTSSTDSSTSQPLDGPNGLFKASRAQETAPLSTVVDADEASVQKSIFTAPNLFDTCMPAAQSASFGANTIKPHPGFMALINSHSKSRTSRLDRAPCQDYADGLCTYEEPDAWGNEYTNCRYMTLPSFFSGLGGKNSFEEVRLANYKWELIDGDAIPKCSVKPANSVQNVETIGSAKEPAVPAKSPWQAPCGFKDLAARLDGPRTRPIPQASRRYFNGIGSGSTNLLPSQAVDRSNICTFPYEGQPKSESAEAQDLAALPESAFGSSKVAVSTNTFEFGAHINPVPAPVKAPSVPSEQAPPESTAIPSKAKAEENQTTDTSCRKYAASATNALCNNQSLRLCLACAGKETACWLCHDASEPVASKGAVAPTTGKRERAPSPRISLPETAAARKLMAKEEDFNPGEETEEMWSTRYDLLQKCQIY